MEPFGPFVDLLVSPELMTRVGALGEYLRYRSALAPRLSEFAILVTAAAWQQPFEWEIHAPIALKEGIPQATIDALWSGAMPRNLEADQQALYDLCTELHRDRLVTPRRTIVRSRRSANVVRWMRSGSAATTRSSRWC